MDNEEKKPETFKFRTSTYIAPLVIVGDYWGPFEYESFWGSEVEYHREENEIVCNDYDGLKFNQVQCEELNNVFDEEKPMEELGVVSIRAVEPIIPRERNFMDNAVDIEVEVTKDFLENVEKLTMKKENHDKIAKYIEDNWKTRDGFTSGMPVEDIMFLPQLFQDLGDAPVEEYYDEYRMWGSVLALAWFLTGGDFDEDCDELSDGPLTMALYDKMREHDLEEFCTILGRQEAVSKYTGHTLNFGKFKAQLDRDMEKYKECGVGEESKAVAERYKKRVLELVESYESQQDDIIADFHPNYDDVVKYLDELREKWEFDREHKLEEFWK